MEKDCYNFKGRKQLEIKSYIYIYIYVCVCKSCHNRVPQTIETYCLQFWSRKPDKDVGRVDSFCGL